MTQHIPVMLNESIEGLNLNRSGVYIDATFGRGGHSMEILKRLDQNSKLLVIDRDPDAIKVAKSIAANDSRMIVQHGSFDNIAEYCRNLNIYGKVYGVLVDLGVSSPQLDEPSRGFSFSKNGPLDMRMDPTSGISAAQWLQTVTIDDLSNVLYEYGEEKFAKRIAAAIVAQNKIAPINDTVKLAAIISDAVPITERNKHPATRSFQAIRIFINDELKIFKDFLNDIKGVLAIGGRLAVLSFHGLEHKIIKNFIKDNKDFFQKIGGKQRPTKDEISVNRRSRSVFLRVIERIEI